MKTPDVDSLLKAIEFSETYFPLPRCEHGNALEDHGGEQCFPSCGCTRNSRRG